MEMSDSDDDEEIEAMFLKILSQITKNGPGQSQKGDSIVRGA